MTHFPANEFSDRDFLRDHLPEAPESDIEQAPPAIAGSGIPVDWPALVGGDNSQPIMYGCKDILLPVEDAPVIAEESTQELKQVIHYPAGLSICEDSKGTWYLVPDADVQPVAEKLNPGQWLPDSWAPDCMPTGDADRAAQLAEANSPQGKLKRLHQGIRGRLGPEASC